MKYLNELIILTSILLMCIVDCIIGSSQMHGFDFQLYTFIKFITIMYVCYAVWSLKKTISNLNTINKNLEDDFLDRTKDLYNTIDKLQEEITERIRLKQELDNKTKEKTQVQVQLQEKEHILLQQSPLASMGEMVSNIAHQWRQPLNVLALLAQEMMMTYECGNLTEEYLNNNVNKMMETIGHMSNTIDDFRWFFKPDKRKRKFKIHDILNKTLSLVQDTINERVIHINIHSECDPVVTGFPNEFCQVLLNIINNASEALTINRVTNPTIKISVWNECNKIVLTIADNAGGIPENIIYRIFDPYFTTKGPDKGTGVGLYMSKTIIEKNMNGSLTAMNVGDGAEFRIEI